MTLAPNYQSLVPQKKINILTVGTLNMYERQDRIMGSLNNPSMRVRYGDP